MHEVRLVVGNGRFAAQFSVHIIDDAFLAGIGIAVFYVAYVFAMELDLADFDMGFFLCLDVGQEVDSPLFAAAFKEKVYVQVTAGTGFNSQLACELRLGLAQCISEPDGTGLAGCGLYSTACFTLCKGTLQFFRVSPL